jgi:hypothetical protein
MASFAPLIIVSMVDVPNHVYEVVSAVVIEDAETAAALYTEEDSATVVYCAVTIQLVRGAIEVGTGLVVVVWARLKKEAQRPDESRVYELMSVSDTHESATRVLLVATQASSFQRWCRYRSRPCK